MPRPVECIPGPQLGEIGDWRCDVEQNACPALGDAPRPRHQAPTLDAGGLRDEALVISRVPASADATCKRAIRNPAEETLRRVIAAPPVRHRPDRLANYRRFEMVRPFP